MRGLACETRSLPTQLSRELGGECIYRDREYLPRSYSQPAEKLADQNSAGLTVCISNDFNDLELFSRQVSESSSVKIVGTGCLTND